MNQPQVRLPAFSRSPTLRPPICAVPRVSHLSKKGCGSPNTVPVPWGATTPGLLAVEKPGGQAGELKTLACRLPQVAPKVLPLTRLSAPGVDGPEPLLNELSLIAKRR